MMKLLLMWVLLSPALVCGMGITALSEEIKGGVLLEKGDLRVLVSPRNQGRVLVAEKEGECFGWVNLEALKNGRGGGGLDRFWFGPDGSQFTVFFRPGAPLEEGNWRVPDEVAGGEMTVTKRGEEFLEMERDIEVKNHLGTEFRVRLLRTVSLSNRGLKVTNVVTNLGEDWSEERGLLAIWNLASLQGRETTRVIFPVQEVEKVQRYFEPFREGQLHLKNGRASFRCSGNWRSKIGLKREDCAGFLSVREERDSSDLVILTMRYAVGTGQRYPHAERGPQKRPYAGDLMNVYNHGTLDRSPLAEAAFYELESASAMPELRQGESFSHWQELDFLPGEEDRPFGE